MDYLLKSSAIIILFYGCYKLFLQRETYFQSNRWFLLVGLFLSSILPLVVIPIYIQYTPTPITFYETTEIISQPLETTTSNYNYWDLLFYTYYAGLLFFFTRLSSQFISLITLLKKHKKNKEEQFYFIETDKNIAPFSFFNRIVFNRNNFSLEELNLIITHEKVHAKQLHSIDVIIVQLATVLFWFNPFIWWYKKELQQNLEFIADQNAQQIIDCAKSYQTLLLKASLNQNQLALSNNFYQSLIKKRIVMLQKSKSKNSSYFKLAFILPFLGLFLMSFNVKEIYIAKEEVYVNKLKTEIFTIKATSTDQDIEAIKNRLEVQTDGLKIKFSDIKRDTNNKITNLSIETKPKDKTAYTKHITYKHKDGKPIGNIALTVEKGELNFGYEDFEMNMKVTEDGLTTVLTESTSKKKVTDIGNIHVQNDGDNINVIIDSEDKQDNSFTYKIKTDDTGGKKSKLIFTDTNKSPLYIIDGKIGNSIESIDTDKIESVNVLKGKSAVNLYGSKGENGVIVITTKKHFEDDKKLYILDGKEISKSDLLKVYAIETVSSLNVLKPKEATKKYGKKGINGVVEVTSKNKNSTINNIDKTFIFTSKKVEITDSINPKKVIIKYPNGDVNASQTSYSNRVFSNDSTIIIINGKKVNNGELSKLNPDNIKSMTVLRGKSASEVYGSVYGSNSENGVIELTTKNDSTKIKSPWSYQVTNVTYVDTDDISKNGTFYYISKSTPESILKGYITDLEKAGIEAKYSKVKRNNKGKITSIKISLSDNKGQKSSATFKDNKGISDIKFGLKNGNLIITGSDIDVD